ncbi:MAG TPA: hypothetical protein VNO32_61940 [Candidatus Acidoferrum sp.]|nr:hypothetical protein [Candidatus Acidoferrum sp.]
MLKTLLVDIPRECQSSQKSGADRATTPLAPIAACNMRGPSIHIALVVLLLASLADAQTLTGTVRNSTTGKPAGGDELILFNLSRGMEESGRIKADAKGNFSFTLDDAQSPHLLRAIHDGVTYHRMAPPGTTSIAIEVYDAARKVDGVGVIADIMRIQTAEGRILVTRDFGVRNASNPPRTQMSERNLEFYVPDGAQFIGGSATATSANGTPLKAAPLPEREKNRYSFIFPLRPGFTHFEVAYQLPYSGSANLDPRSIYPVQNFVVILPKAMQFHAAAGSEDFKLMNDSNQPDANVQVAANTKGGQNLGFNISGDGALETGQQSGTQGSGKREQGSPGGASGSSNSRPGGGLGPPIDAPDPLQEYRWWILGSCAAVMLIGSIYAASRRQSTTPALRHKDFNRANVGTVEGTRAFVGARTNNPMEGIKEELFQIELEHKRGQISQSEYEKAKSALDQTLARALKPQTQKA